MITAPTASIIWIFDGPIPVIWKIKRFIPTTLYPYRSTLFIARIRSVISAPISSAFVAGILGPAALIARKIIGVHSQEFLAFLVVITFDFSLVDWGLVNIPIFHPVPFKNENRFILKYVLRRLI